MAENSAVVVNRIIFFSVSFVVSSPLSLLGQKLDFCKFSLAASLAFGVFLGLSS